VCYVSDYYVYAKLKYSITNNKENVKNAVCIDDILSNFYSGSEKGAFMY
jgi:hypothetical protein